MLHCNPTNGLLPMLKELQSKLVEAVLYYKETQRLTIHLTNGQRREYVDVPSHVYDGLLTAKSPGEYYQKTIKPNFTLAD